MAKAIIVAVRKDENGVITHVKAEVWVDGEQKPDQVQAKYVALQNILTFKWNYTVADGTPVHVVKRHYLRTDGNQTEEDNLGELPIF